MNVLDLFSGIGGFSLGLERAGMHTVAFCENEPFCQKVLAKHWPDVPLYPDIRELTGEQIKADGITAELICGGFPCQPFSHAGQRRGTKDDRHLWPELLRLVGEIKPAWCLFENVTGLLSMVEYDSFPPVDAKGFAVGAIGDTFHRTGRGYFREILESLTSLGYKVQSFCIPACAVDAKHRRDRVWIVANTKSNGDRRKLRDHHGSPGKDGDWSYESVCNGEEGSRGENVSNTMRGRWQGSGERRPVCQGESSRQAEGQPDESTSFWPTEPSVGRVAHGVPARVDRLKALGNAVVVPLVTVLGRTIMEADKT